jgi:hypothetical protein
MYGQQQGYRIGDLARSSVADGDYIFLCKTLEGAKSKDGKPQLKVSGTIVDGPNPGSNHTWYYNCWEGAMFRFFTDLVNMGLPADAQVPTELDAAGNFVWPGYFGPAFVGHAFRIRVSTRNDYSNTEIVERAQLGPDGRPIAPMTVAPTITAPTPAAVFPAPAAAPVATTAPEARTGFATVTDLFKQG